MTEWQVARLMISETELVDRIEAMGGQVYLVGGWVRDMLIGRPSHDKDYVVCGLTAEDITRTFEAERVGRAFPVFLIDVDGTPCEVSLARTEEKTSSGYRGFSVRFDPSTTIEEDLYRRDATMNSMALRLPDMTLVDPYNGTEDIRNKIIRATSWHFREDPVRSLRAARLSAQLDFTIEEGTVGLMALTRDELMHEPVERIFSELRKAMESPKPDRFFRSLYDAGLTGAIFDVKPDMERFCHALGALDRTAWISGSPQARFAAFALGLYEPAAETSNVEYHIKIRLPSSWQKLIRFIAENRAAMSEISSAYESVCLLERMKRLSLDTDDVSAVIMSLDGGVPACLENAACWKRAISQARSDIRIPETVPAAMRSKWLSRAIAERIEKMST